MSFIDHLEELRSVLLACLAALGILGFGAWFVSAQVMDFLVRYAGLTGAQAIRPQEIFATRLKISVTLGLLVGMPYIAARVWGFVVPGLLHRERRVVYPLVFWSTVLFLGGAVFSFLMLTPIMLSFLAGFATSVVAVNPSVGFVLDFYIHMSIACGLLFQLPLAVAMLTFFGILSPMLLKRFWRHAVVIILILAAVVTPADVISQLALGVPVILLYFASILVSVAIHRSRVKREAQEETRDDQPGPDEPPDASGSPPGSGPVPPPPAAMPPPPPLPPDPRLELPGGAVRPDPAAELAQLEDEARRARGALPAGEAAADGEAQAEGAPIAERSQPPQLHPPDTDWTI